MILQTCCMWNKVVTKARRFKDNEAQARRLRHRVVGLYGCYNMLVLGMWYRGIPVKSYTTELSNHDAMNFLVGFIHNSFNIGYSYDLTISKLGMQSGGSHELSLTYTWLLLSHPKKKIKRAKVVCPKF